MSSVFDIFKKEKDVGRNKALIVKHLSNKYNNKTFLDNISFVVYRGEIFSVIGLSGSGKSSLLKNIIGLYPKSQGEVFFFNKHPFFSKHLIGYCPQDDSFLSDLTVKENIELFSSINKVKKDAGLKIGREYLKKLKLDKFINQYPTKFSGGQKKRLNIILSALHKPKLLILDEPFAGLDYYNRRILWDFLTELKNLGVSIILTTHLLKEAQEYSSRVLIMKHGKKFAYGTFKEIKEKVKFNYIYHIKFSRLSKKFFDKLTDYCKFKNIRIIYNFKREIQFALDYEKDKEKISKFLARTKQQFEEVSISKPNLDEIMLASK